MERFDAILPAGGQIDAAFSKQVGTTSKALIQLGGRTVLARTLGALQDSGRVGRTVVIGSPEVLNHADSRLASDVLAEGNSGPENIFKGLAALGGPGALKKVLVVTTDLPFLTPEIIEGFVSNCPKNADICVPLINRVQFQERFPEAKATFVSLKDNVWTTGCAYLIDAQAMQNAKLYIERVFENRKSKVGMAKLLGPAFVFKWLTKQLTLADVERKIQGLLGCSGAAVTGSAPELAYDIDYPEDYDYAVRHLNGKA